jgi:hypothetical protein
MSRDERREVEEMKQVRVSKNVIVTRGLPRGGKQRRKRRRCCILRVIQCIVLKLQLLTVCGIYRPFKHERDGKAAS